MTYDAELEAQLHDPSTPRWAKVVIREAMKVDAVDAANVLKVLAELFERRCSAILEGAK